jgi:hypothetical protein
MELSGNYRFSSKHDGFTGGIFWSREKRIYYHANRSNRLVRMGRRHKVKSAFRAEPLIQS